MRSIAVVTSGRADYGICLPILRAISARPDVTLHLLVTGTHLSDAFGRTVSAIEADGFPIADRIEMLVDADTPEAIAASMGHGTVRFAESFARRRPDILLLPGDRFEIHAAAVAALPFNLPIGHLHGGELTHFAIDDALRHSLTKLSHVHFVSTDSYARRVIQMGEEPWRVIVSGAPALESLASTRLMPVAEIADRLQMELDRPPLLVTFHPVTRDVENTDKYVAALLEAVGEFAGPVILTLPNADTSGRRIADAMRAFVSRRANARFIPNLGVEAYFSVMSVAAAMAGNSSSGLIEAPSFGLPVVNIGDRQQGRVRAANVIDTTYDAREISAAIRRACDPRFKSGLRGLVNPYARPGGVQRIVETLATVPLDQQLIVKRFWDQELVPS